MIILHHCTKLKYERSSAQKKLSLSATLQGAKFQRFAHMNYRWFSSVDEGPKEREFHVYKIFFYSFFEHYYTSAVDSKILV